MEIVRDKKEEFKVKIDSIVNKRNVTRISIYTPFIRLPIGEESLINLFQANMLKRQIEEYIENKHNGLSYIAIYEYNNIYDTVYSSVKELESNFRWTGVTNDTNLIIFMNMNIDNESFTHYKTKYLSKYIEKKNVMFINTDGSMSYLDDEEYCFSIDMEGILNILSGKYSRITGKTYRDIKNDYSIGTDIDIIHDEELINDIIERYIN